MSWHIHEVYSWWCWYILMSHCWWLVDTLLVYTWYMVGCTCLWYKLITGCLAQVGAWLKNLFMLTDWYMLRLLPHLSWWWDCKLSLAYRSGALVEFYSIQLLLKKPQIEVNNKKKNCTYILCSLWRLFVDDMLLICIHI